MGSSPAVQILDGGLGTSLEDGYGVVFDHSMPLWSTHFLVDGTHTLRACQRDFAAAGADVLLTATYQVSVEGFARTRTAEFPEGIPQSAIGGYLETAVEILEEAAAADGGNGAKLALSLGPYGACMVPGQEYSGKYDGEHDSEEALFRWHLNRLRLATDHVAAASASSAVKQKQGGSSSPGSLMNRLQYVALETIPRVDEVRAVRRAVGGATASSGSNTLPPFWVSCVFPGDDQALPDGTGVSQVVEAMLLPSSDEEVKSEGAGASAGTTAYPVPWGIGINCTKIHKLRGLICAFEDAVGALLAAGRIDSPPALVLYPDGTRGEVYNTTTKKWELPEGHVRSGEDRETWATQLANIVSDSQKRGVFKSFLVGGCCKASAADIKELRDIVHGPKSKA
ncbi:Homocysteine S-methyltransferase [Xylariales sp. PMI_506]|nr:Homocysteine S-methyltransferase [Xylariales sp. PMI_506]